MCPKNWKAKLIDRTDVMALNHYKEEETSPNNTEHTSSVDTAPNGARRPR